MTAINTSIHSSSSKDVCGTEVNNCVNRIQTLCSKQLEIVEFLQNSASCEMSRNNFHHSSSGKKRDKVVDFFTS